jgi:hypothetical protein
VGLHWSPAFLTGSIIKVFPFFFSILHPYGGF